MIISVMIIEEDKDMLMQIRSRAKLQDMRIKTVLVGLGKDWGEEKVKQKANYSSLWVKLKEGGRMTKALIPQPAMNPQVK